MMIKNIGSIELTEEMVKFMFVKNPNFKETVQQIIYDSDIEYVQVEYLNNLHVHFELNSLYLPWYGGFNELETSDDILDGSWCFELRDRQGNTLDWKRYLTEMEKLNHRLKFRVPIWSKAYDLLEDKLSKMIVCFLDSLQDEIDSIINCCYEDDDYLVDQFCYLNDGICFDDYYLNDETLEIFKLVG